MLKIETSLAGSFVCKTFHANRSKYQFIESVDHLAKTVGGFFGI
jgi:hypothetical protein